MSRESVSDMICLYVVERQVRAFANGVHDEELTTTEAVTWLAERLGVEIPLSGSELRHIWKPGEPVDLVSHPGGPYGAEHLRPGVVVNVDEELRRVRRLRVQFDDGEERHINPDVMRHRRTTDES